MIKKKRMLTVFTVLAWLTVIIPLLMLFRECLDSFLFGTYHGFNTDEYIYGMSAAADTFLLFLWIFFPLFILWGIMLIVAVVMTVVVIKRWMG